MQTKPHLESKFDALRLYGGWQVQPTPLDAPSPAGDDWLRVPDCAHLQPVLYPDQPYWGDHLRAISRQDLRAEVIEDWLRGLGLQQVSARPTTPTLEDVFLALSD